MLKDFKVSENALPLPVLNPDEIKFSISLKKDAISFIDSIEKSNNYLVGLLKMLNIFQDQRS